MSTKNSVNKSKGKKSPETFLGNSSSISNAEESKDEKDDLSHLQKPIETSVFGLKQVLSLLNTATDEVKNFVSYECEIMFECRICRSIFRSLANFIIHKRKYCQDKYTNAKYWKSSEDNVIETIEVPNITSNDEADLKSVNGKDFKTLNSVLDKLMVRQQCALFTQETVNEDFTVKPSSSDGTKVKDESLVLEKIKDCDKAIFQTRKSNIIPFELDDDSKSDMMKLEVMEIHSILENDEAILGPDGKVMPTSKALNNLPRKDLVCTICNFKFATKKTLTCHIKYKHNNKKIVYPCPECKENLSSTWCVFRHLIKIHRKSPSDIKKLRNSINDSGVIKEQDSSKPDTDADKVNNISKDTEEDHNQQWMDDFESANDLQMCGGCGKRFERKAALNAHSQICLKRIALCNSIKGNAKLEDQEKKKEKQQTIPVNQPKGSEKRKPSVSRRNPTTVAQEKIEQKSEVVETKLDIKDEEIVVIKEKKDNESGTKIESKSTEKGSKKRKSSVSRRNPTRVVQEKIQQRSESIETKPDKTDDKIVVIKEKKENESDTKIKSKSTEAETQSKSEKLLLKKNQNNWELVNSEVIDIACENIRNEVVANYSPIDEDPAKMILDLECISDTMEIESEIIISDSDYSVPNYSSKESSCTIMSRTKGTSDCDSTSSGNSKTHPSTHFLNNSNTVDFSADKVRKMNFQVNKVIQNLKRRLTSYDDEEDSFKNSKNESQATIWCNNNPENPESLLKKSKCENEQAKKDEEILSSDCYLTDDNSFQDSQESFNSSLESKTPSPNNSKKLARMECPIPKLKIKINSPEKNNEQQNNNLYFSHRPVRNRIPKALNEDFLYGKIVHFQAPNKKTCSNKTNKKKSITKSTTM